MPRAALSIIERRSLLEAHNRRCFYHGEPLLFNDMEVDHLIPISVEADSGEKASILQQLGQSGEFNFNSFGNFVPACRQCNQRKRDLKLEIGFIAISLAKTLALLPRIEELISKYTAQAKTEKFRVTVLTALENSEWNFEEILNIVKYNKLKSGKVTLSDPIDIFHGQTIFEIDKNVIENLFNKEIAVNGELGEKLKLVNDNNEEVFVNTLNQFREAFKSGYYPYTNAEMKIADHYFFNKIQLFKTIEAAKVPNFSYIQDIGLTDLRFMPATILSSYADITEDLAFADNLNRLSALTIKDLIDEGRATIKDTQKGLLRLEFDHWESIFIEEFRADINDDGVEDLIYYWVGFPVDGTMRVSGMRAMTRMSKDEILQEVEQKPLSEENI